MRFHEFSMMYNNNLETQERTGGNNWLLVLGLTLAPMTELRVWKIGPAELFCVLWCVRYLRCYFEGGVNRPLPAFWLSFLLILTAGTLFCMQYYPTESSGFGGLLTWFFMMFLSLGVHAGLSRRTTEEILHILESISFLSAAWYFFLLLYSRIVSSTFFGARLWYGVRRFTGGGANPHQMAILSLGMIFASLFFLLRVKMSRRKRFLHLTCMIVEIYILYLTRSTTVWMAMIVTMAFAVGLVTLRGIQATSTGNIRLVAFLTISAVVFILGFTWLFSLFMEWVSADSNGLHRFQLYSDIIDPLQKNFLFGLGDGTHADSGYMEFHNTYLEIIGMTGLIGTSLFIVFTVRIIKTLKRDPYLLLIPFALYVYGLAGFGLRRLPYWALTSFVIAIAEKLPPIREARARIDPDAPAPETAPGAAVGEAS